MRIYRARAGVYGDAKKSMPGMMNCGRERETRWS